MAYPTDSPPTPPASGEVVPAPVRLNADIAALTHQGLVRETNEDSYIVFRLGRFLERVTSNIPESEIPSHTDQTGNLMIVADGMGGHQAGEVASRTALVKTIQLIARAPHWALNLSDPATREKEIHDLLVRSRAYLAKIHQALRAQAEGDSRLLGMGTTLTGAYTLGKDMFVLHVGDSKAYLARGGIIRKITRDHTVAQQYADLGVIPQEAVPNHNLGHVLTRAVGAPMEELQGDLHHLRLEHGDRLLLCSDGLTDMASEAEILGVLSKRPTSEQACRGLVDLALLGGGRDNITVIVAGYRME